MPLNTILFIDGLDHNTADAGIPINSLPVTSGAKGIVTDYTIIWGGRDLPPNDLAISLQGAPYPGTAFTTGTDENGAIGVAKVATLAAPPFDTGTHWSTSAGTLVLEDGFWASDVRVFISDITGTRQIQIDILVLELSDLTESLNDPPTDLIASDPSWDPEAEQGNVTLNWSYTNLGDDPFGFAILRDGEIVGTVPFETGEEDYEFIDYLAEEGEYEYEIVTYTTSPDLVSPPSSPPVVVVIDDDGPDISITSDMALAFEWNSVMAFITDPSGLYGLIPNKTHDTLYNRDAVETSIDVKIPDPFVKLAFLPEE